MLHEELIIDWNEISNIIHDFHFMETIRGQLTVGVSILNLYLYNFLLLS